MWYLSIIISIVFAIAFIIYLNILFSKLIKELDILASGFINHFNRVNPYISIGNRFSNITSNIILKEVIFIVIALIIHFTGSLTLTNFYIILVLLAWWVFNRRRKELNILPEESKETFKPYVFNSYITIPIFQTILYLLCFLTYRLNY